MIRFLFAALLLVAAPASAQTLLSGFVSHHFRGEFCEQNHGVGIRLDSGEWAGWAVGAYRNSLCRTSVYAAKEWTRPLVGPLHGGIILGAATGYKWAVAPVLLPELVFRHSPVEIALVLQPINLRESPAFVALQFRWDFSSHSR